jgi:hypothetical protein
MNRNHNDVNFQDSDVEIPNMKNIEIQWKRRFLEIIVGFKGFTF